MDGLVEDENWEFSDIFEHDYITYFTLKPLKISWIMKKLILRVLFTKMKYLYILHITPYYSLFFNYY